MDEELEIIPELKKKMDGSINTLKHSLSGLRTGRASTALLEPIKVEVYGNVMPISQLASITVSDARTLMIQVWDKELIADIEKAIINSKLGLTPNTEGQVIRLFIPDLTEERRKELVKKAHAYGEQAKIAIRNIRRNGLDIYKKHEKEKLISEDELKSYTEKIQELTDDYIKKVDTLLNNKSKHILM